MPEPHFRMRPSFIPSRLRSSLAHILLGGSLGLFAQTAPPQNPAAPPPYLPLRYDEDYTYLKDPARHTDVWDPVKYVSLSREGWYLSLGGEARERYEGFKNTGFGGGTQDPNGFLLNRYLFHADVHLGPHVRVFTQLQSGFANGRRGGPRATDEDKLEFHQAFIDFQASSDSKHGITLRLGRQEFEFGSGRLIGASELLNVRRSFDGARITARAGQWTLHSLAAKPAETNPGYFDDSPDPRQTLFGAGAVRSHPLIPGGSLSLYYIGYMRRLGRFNAGAAEETRHTIGSRSFGTHAASKLNVVDYNLEFVHQWGNFGSSNIRAWAAASDVGHVWAQAPLAPRLGLRMDAASGDRNQADRKLESYNPLFPSTAYSGKIGLLGPTNIVDVNPVGRLRLHPKVYLSLEWAWFFRQSLNDGIYGIAVNLFKAGQSSRARYVANQPTALCEFRLNRHVTLTGILTQFRAGTFIKETPPSKNVGYATGYLTYRF